MSFVASGSAGGSGSGLPTDSWLANLFSRPSTESAHTDDDEFDTDTSADYTEVDISAGGGQTVAIDAHVASIIHAPSSGASGDFQGILKPITSASAPITVQTVYEGHGGGGTNGHGTPYVCFTDGVVAGSNLVAAAYAGGIDFRINYGTLTAMDSSTTSAALMGNDLPGWTSRLYMRVIWKSANTFTAQWSVDGVGWNDFGLGNIAKTMTPTHVGVGFSNWGVAEGSNSKFDYLRLTDSDLSL